ncbi:MAG: HlyD family efflux transporter periplasmic adaptor subunit, partial [Actinobacteria bacterium]|nr:HlyD family efflux transporter periplasmic adaptor subunit [Actinomycetota bacterium]
DAVESVQQACSSSRPDGTGPPDPTTTSTTSTTMPSTPTTTTTTPGTGAPSDCQSALESAMSAQEAVSEAQHAVSQAATAFDALLADMTGTSAHGQGQQHASGDTTGSSTQTSAASATAGSGAVGAASGQRSQTTDGSGTSAAQTLITRQQSVDGANAAVAQATQARAQATIVSPMAGRVVAITLTVGESVTAASSTETVTVAGPAGSEVTMLVPVANLPSVRIGQTASVQPDGSNRSYPGKVVSIGLTPSSGQSTTVYPVSVALTSPTADPGFLGSTASVSIHIHSAPDAIAVPTSAVTANGSRHSVQVVRSGEVAAVPVTVGAVGPTWTQVTSGLRLGESVVLADFHLPLPGSATQSSSTGASGSGDRNRPGGFGGFGGRGPGD